MNPNTNQAVVTEVFGHIAPLILVVPYLTGLVASRVDFTPEQWGIVVIARNKKRFIIDLPALEQSRRMLDYVLAHMIIYSVNFPRGMVGISCTDFCELQSGR